MGKKRIKAHRPVYPSPAALIACRSTEGKNNIITLGEVFNISIEKPVIIGIAVRNYRYSYKIIKEAGIFTVNFPDTKIIEKVDKCGTSTGSKTDKFKEFSLTPIDGEMINAPIIKECKINLECRVLSIQEIGDHDLIIAEVLAQHVDDNILDEKNKIDISKLDSICYFQNEYWSMGNKLGEYGYSLKKEK